MIDDRDPLNRLSLSSLTGRAPRCGAGGNTAGLLGQSLVGVDGGPSLLAASTSIRRLPSGWRW